MREHRPVWSLHERLKVALDGIGVVMNREAKTPSQSADMRVDGDTGDAEGVAEYHVGGLAPDPAQSDQVLHRCGDLPVVPLDEVPRKPEEGLRLRAEEPCRPHEFLNPLAGRCRKGHGVGVGGEEGGGDLVDPDVRALRGEYGRDEQLERIPEVKFTASVRVFLSEEAEDPTGTLDQGMGRRTFRASGDGDGVPIRHPPSVGAGSRAAVACRYMP